MLDEEVLIPLGLPFRVEADAYSGHDVQAAVPLREGEKQGRRHPGKLVLELPGSAHLLPLLLEQHGQPGLVDNPVGSVDRDEDGPAEPHHHLHV